MAKTKKPARRFVTDKTDLLENSIHRELAWAGDRIVVEKGTATDKKNYAEGLSRALSQRFADALRSSFEGILPNPDGFGQESKARTGKGLKKLDVNYSTVELGLGLGVSIKTINFRDAKTKRYTKNYTRVDNELRAEAADYHERQPYAVLCAVVFLPLDACDDGGSAPSSFGQAVQIFRYRGGRERAVDDSTLFERILIGLYDAVQPNFGATEFFDVMEAPPRTGRPSKSMTFEKAIDAIIESYDARNRSSFKWAEGETEILAASDRNEEEDET